MPLGQRHVSEIMRREVATLAPDENLDLGDDVMNLGRVRHLPVVDGGRLVGMVSRSDTLAVSLAKAFGFDPAARRAFLEGVRVADVMAREVVTVRPATSLAEAAELLVSRQIGALPVVVDGELVGLVTQTDLLAAAYGLDGLEREETAMEKKSEFSEWLDGEIDELRRARDELRVQVHLAKAEVRDRWEEAEKGLASLERRAKQVTRAAEEPLHQLEADARKLADDLRAGYRRIRAAL